MHDNLVSSPHLLRSFSQSFADRVANVCRAVGVNLPARVVIIRGTTSWINGKIVSYSDLDVVQASCRARSSSFSPGVVDVFV